MSSPEDITMNSILKSQISNPITPKSTSIMALLSLIIALSLLKTLLFVLIMAL